MKYYGPLYLFCILLCVLVATSIFGNSLIKDGFKSKTTDATENPKYPQFNSSQMMPSTLMWPQVECPRYPVNKKLESSDANDKTNTVTDRPNVSIKSKSKSNVTSSVTPTSNITPNITPNITSNITPNITSNVTSNVTPNVTSNVTPAYDVTQTSITKPLSTFTMNASSVNKSSIISSPSTVSTNYTISTPATISNNSTCGVSMYNNKLVDCDGKDLSQLLNNYMPQITAPPTSTSQKAKCINIKQPIYLPMNKPKMSKSKPTKSKPTKSKPTESKPTESKPTKSSKKSEDSLGKSYRRTIDDVTDLGEDIVDTTGGVVKGVSGDIKDIITGVSGDAKNTILGLVNAIASSNKLADDDDDDDDYDEYDEYYEYDKYDDEYCYNRGYRDSSEDDEKYYNKPQLTQPPLTQKQPSKNQQYELPGLSRTPPPNISNTELNDLQMSNMITYFQQPSDFIPITNDFSKFGK